MFIDVGTKRDALLHIKDISKDYFVENIEAKFIPGQDLEVWIKFIDSDRGKVGLQMYPLDSQLPIQLEKVSFEDLQVQQELPGVVVKFSKFGAYLDIGMKQPAFLNRRMMKINRRQRNYQPWEILSTGTVVTCYVHSLDKSRGRVSLTTYEPSKWMERLPASISSEASFADDDEEDLIDDNEELGGDTRAANLRALERTLSLSIDDDDDDDEDTGTDSSLSKGVEEVLSVEEIRRLTKGRDAKILIDDVGTEESSSTSKSSKSDRNIDKSLEPDYEMSSEELFEEIGNGKSQIYMKDLKKWDYLRDLLDDKAVDNDTLKKIFKQASRGQTALDVDQFDEFVDLLAESLEFDDVDEDFDETSLLSSPEFTSIRLDDKTSEVDEDEELRDLEFVVDGKSLYKKEDDEIKKFLEEGKLQDLDSNVEVDLEKAAISSAVAESLYTSLVGKKKTMEFSDVLGWTLVQSLLKEDKLTTSNVMDIFNLCSEGKDVLVPENFAKFVSLLADMEKNMRLSEESTSVAIDLGRSNISEEDEDGLDEELLKSVFQSLSNGKGFVTVKDLLNWDMVLDLLGEVRLIFTEAINN